MFNLIQRSSGYVFLCFFIELLASCGGSPVHNSRLGFSANFESGSLPVVKQLDAQGLSYELALRADNDDANLPDNFRTWWYFQIDKVPTQQSVHLEFTRFGFPFYFVPVYSYDGKQWDYFDEREVTLQPGCHAATLTNCRLIVNKNFTEPTVWIVRTFPYTTQDLANFLSTISHRSYVQIETLGFSPKLTIPLQLITISDTTIISPKKTVFIHARTHAAETGPSFVVEGLIWAALADDVVGKKLRQNYIFKIVPMHNPDGVYVGNYRTNATSINLEKQWIFGLNNPYLDDEAAWENQLVNQGAMVPALLNQAAPVVLALNLHSSNTEPDTAAFIFPHFGSDPEKYSAAQQHLWSKQNAFIRSVAMHYDGRVEPPPVDGGNTFLNSFYPETWWWENTADAVTAMTAEVTYGRAGFDHWVTQNDLRNFGVAIAQAIADMDLLQAQGIRNGDTDAVFRPSIKPEIYHQPE